MSATGRTCRASRARLQARPLAGVTLHNRRDVDRTRRALTSIHKADRDGSVDIAAPCKCVGLRVLKVGVRAAEKFLKYVSSTPWPSPCSKRGREGEVEGVASEARSRVLVGVRVKAGLLGGCAVLVVICPLLLILQDLYIDRVNAAGICMV